MFGEISVLNMLVLLKPREFIRNFCWFGHVGSVMAGQSHVGLGLVTPD